MEKNYYDLITSMIKEHRKYPGCEDILDDIAEYVYKQAKTVISSIEDENVIKTYLEKIVTTALITVPRKFCINIRNKKDENVVEEIINKTKSPEHTLFETEIQEETLTEIQEEITGEHFEENNIEEVATIEPIEKTIEEIDVPETLNFDEPTVLEETPVEETEENNVTDSLEDTTSVTENVDKTLVDKMINGLSNTDTGIDLTDETVEIDIPDMEEDVEEAESEFENLPDEDIMTEDFDITVIDTDDTEEVLISDEIADTIEEIEDFGTIETVENIEEEEEEEEVIEADNSLQEEAQDDLMTGSLEVDNDSFDILSEDVLTLEQEENSSDDFDIISLDDEDVIENIDIESDDIVEEPQNTEENICDKSSDAEALLKCFAFEPEENNYYLEDILASLKEADNKNPEKQLLKICELKFKQNLSVSAISEKLDLSVTEIVERLNTIIDIVKD